ncbi:MAG: LytTR family DNA-binding domain-containing protein [Rikenellaceae bacterium]|nr:LytTR family DNA-binding domain-containing protein [Rikenellaceae bacterium]
MLELPAHFRKMTSQVIHVVALPLSFFVFMLVYRPFNIDEKLLLGSFSFGVNLTLVSCIILGSMLLTRLLFYFLRRRIDRLTYAFWCLMEVTVAALFVALYVYLMRSGEQHYFSVVPMVYSWLCGVLIFPYVIISLSLFLVAKCRAAEEPKEEGKMRFYDERKNLKLVVTATSVLYIAAEENYIHLYYLDGERVRDYLLRASMKSIEELCARHGLKRCHRSYYLNPTRVQALRKGKEGMLYAELDVAGKEVPISKRYYDAIAAVL